MNKTLWVPGIVIAIIVIFIGGFWMGQPLLASDGAVIDQQPMPIQVDEVDYVTISSDWEAATLFAASCASCHGPTGGGTAVAPALNREEIRTADTDWLIETISYGRPGTAMPAWSVESGRPLNSDQITEMAAFLQAGDWKKAGEMAAGQPALPMGPGMMGPGRTMGRGMMGQGMGGAMGGHGRQP